MGSNSKDAQTTFNKPISVLQPAHPICVEPGTSLEEALRVMQDEHVGCLLITKEYVLKGIITERDFTMDVFCDGVNLKEQTVDEFMTADPEVLHQNDPVLYAVNRMNSGGYRNIPILDDYDRPLGIISVKDLITFVAEHFSNLFLDAPPPREQGKH